MYYINYVSAFTCLCTSLHWWSNAYMLNKQIRFFFFNKISTFLDQRLLCVRAQVPVEFGPSLT